MAQHDVMISGITNEPRADELLRELIENQLDETVEIVWLNVHCSPSSVATTYAFLRLSDPSEHQDIVDVLNEMDHRDRQLRVKINPIATPSSRTDVEYSPRVQHELDKLQKQRKRWDRERQSLVDQIEKLRVEKQSIGDFTIQLEAKIQALESNPVTDEIKTLRDQIRSKTTVLNRLKTSPVTRCSRALVEGFESGIKRLEMTLAEKQQLRQRQQSELTYDLAEASKLRDDLNKAKESLEEEKRIFVVQNQLIEANNQCLELELTEARHQVEAKDRQLQTTQQDNQQLRERVEQLEEENEELRGRVEKDVPLKCPVCLEVYTSERSVVALFCPHMLCNQCH